MQLKVITPEKIIFDDQADELILPTTNGEIAVLPQHVDLLTEITSGEMIIKAKGKNHHIAVTGGFLQIDKGSLSVLAEYAIRSDEIDAKKAQEAQKRAEEILKNVDKVGERDFAIAQMDIRRAVLELKVARKRRPSTMV
jgi:F-type H+-transporting ATPase subunit epsilon